MPQAKTPGKLNSELLSARAEKSLGNRGQESSAIAASTIGINAAPMGQPLERGQSNLDDFVAGGPAEPDDKTRAASIMVRMTPMRVTLTPVGNAVAVHTSLLAGRHADVQRRICIYQIDFVAEANLSAGLLKLCDFREVKVVNFHCGDHHFEGFFPGGAHSQPQ